MINSYASKSKLKHFAELPQHALFSTEIQAKRLHAVIENELTDRQREIVEEYFFKDKSMQQIAKEHGVRPSSVYKVLQRAMRRIARCLKY